MKILHIVTLVTPENAYGGPLRVAINQARQLEAMGHDVTLIAGARGYSGPLPTSVDGVPVRLFRAIHAVPYAGFAGITSPGLLSFVKKEVQYFDVVHVHLARDLLVAPAALWVSFSGVPLVIQAHGMIDESRNPLSYIVDKVLLRRCFRMARAVLWLTEAEHLSLIKLFGDNLNTERIYNGVPAVEKSAKKNSIEDARVKVLFLARLHSRKRPLTFVHVAQRLLAAGLDADFQLVGPDEGEGPAVAEAVRLGDGRVRWTGGVQLEETAAVMQSADVFCLPSIDEPFPMSVLESMSFGVPVIITDTCGLSAFVEETKSGFVVSAEEDDLQKAVFSAISNSQERQIMGENARKLISNKFSIDAVGKHLEAIYMRG